MKETRVLYFRLVVCFLCFWQVFLSRGESGDQLKEWKTLERGLAVADFESSIRSQFGDSKITIVKIDPKYYSLKLICASEHGDTKKTAKEWCKNNSLIATVNAGMFQANGITNVGYMKNYSHLNNRKLNWYKSILAFNPVVQGIPSIQIIDRECQNFENLKDKYQTLVQNIRMINCKRKNVWSQQEKQWSMVALGMDESANVLFIFTRSPYSVHDFNGMLLSLPIAISGAMYLEGGPEASLYCNVNGSEINKFGSFETRFNENDDNNHAWPIPNVIGIVRKEKSHREQ